MSLTLNYLFLLILSLLCCAVVNATSFTAKKFGRFVASGAVASAGYYLASPQLKYLRESDESLAYWSYLLRRSPGGQYLLRHQLYPEFVLKARFHSSGETVVLNSLSAHQTKSAMLFLEAGADPNVIRMAVIFSTLPSTKIFPLKWLNLPLPMD